MPCVCLQCVRELVDTHPHGRRAAKCPECRAETAEADVRPNYGLRQAMASLLAIHMQTAPLQTSPHPAPLHYNPADFSTKRFLFTAEEWDETQRSLAECRETYRVAAEHNRRCEEAMRREWEEMERAAQQQQQQQQTTSRLTVSVVLRGSTRPTLHQEVPESFDDLLRKVLERFGFGDRPVREARLFAEGALVSANEHLRDGDHVELVLVAPQPSPPAPQDVPLPAFMAPSPPPRHSATSTEHQDT
ncbi:unnamed protein product [Vitrella brassicaformis CCMP3155]|uniref:Ubiquitin-like domain-containing protein n=2 Tax=Vitrella brassicaformis TaxID=1169539 RepID=A0A0G4EGT7_VITBC|nr:unnamed protein product [Vitrella brassicaformis CCMP3155]|eukprot:CEL94688.1 unnamed protein product [Vitrella brassicaformis CCMP3155]